MARKQQMIKFDDPPDTLKDCPFYGLELDEEQTQFRDAIWSKDKIIVFCNARAGTGKTTIATATADLLCKYGRYEGIVYISSPTQEQKQGYLAGSIEEKSEPYFEPFYQALDRIGVNINTASYSDIMNQKNGTAYIQCLTHTFLRGCNFSKRVIIIDECQNFYLDELKKVLTRLHDDCKIICIGHSGQIDLYSHAENSGFVRYMEHFKSANDDRVAICNLTKNYRGWISSYADDLKY